LLAEYIVQKYRPDRHERDLHEIDVADVLSIYLEDCAARHSNQQRFRARIGRLNDFWGGMSLTEVNTNSCKKYATYRGNSGGARRELEDLRAAINYHSKEGFHRGNVRIALPAKGAPRDRWLNRQEAARLIRICWRTREVQTIARGARKGLHAETDRYPLRHLARFLLMGLYTGTRSGAILTASVLHGPDRSFVDLHNGLFYRLAQGRRATNKRQPPVPLPPRLMAHLQRWVRLGIINDYVVEWNHGPIRSVKTAFNTAVRLANLSGKVTPHTLRHTAATWLMQSGVPIWEAAGFLGMSSEVLAQTYGHHHPEHMRGAALAIGTNKSRQQSLVVSLATIKAVGRSTKKTS
jgi:integrase